MYVIMFKATTLWHFWYKDEKCDPFIPSKDEAEMHLDRLSKASLGKVKYKLLKVISK